MKHFLHCERGRRREGERERALSNALEPPDTVPQLFRSKQKCWEACGEAVGAHATGSEDKQTLWPVRGCEKTPPPLLLLPPPPPLSDCVSTARVRVFLTALPMLTYVNRGERKRAGVRMTELLSYHRDNLLPGHLVSRKWRLRPAVMRRYLRFTQG